MPIRPRSNVLWACDVCFGSLRGKRVVSLILLYSGEEIIKKGIVKEYDGAGMIIHYHVECAEKRVNFRKDRAKVECSTDFLFDSVRRRRGELRDIEPE